MNDFKIYKTVTVWTPLTVSQPYLATCLYQTRDEAFLCRLAHQGAICPDDDDKKSMCVVNFMAINEDLSGRDLSLDPRSRHCGYSFMIESGRNLMIQITKIPTRLRESVN